MGTGLGSDRARRSKQQRTNFGVVAFASNPMKTTQRKLAFLLAVAGGVIFTSTARAILLTDPGVVGTVTLNGNTDNANATTAANYLNQLLSMVANQTLTIPLPDGLIYQTGPTNYNGAVNAGNATRVDDGSGNVPAGYSFVIAKYDGQNAGYVAWALNGAAMVLPIFPAPTFTSNSAQYALSGWTAFPAPSVPEGGNVLALLAFGLLTAESIRRRLL